MTFIKASKTLLELKVDAASHHPAGVARYFASYYYIWKCLKCLDFI